jgi:hypothetical protein
MNFFKQNYEIVRFKLEKQKTDASRRSLSVTVRCSNCPIILQCTLLMKIAAFAGVGHNGNSQYENLGITGSSLMSHSQLLQ